MRLFADDLFTKQVGAMLPYVELFIFLFVILVAAQIFTNALEHLGEWLKISEGVTGSLFAAVGTALPEAIIPILAIASGTSHSHINHDISIGAILGAPLMLSTITCGLMALFAIKKRGFSGHLHPESSGLKRDLNFFLASYVLATIAMFLPKTLGTLNLHHVLLLTLVGLYFIYSLITLRASKNLVETGHGTIAEHPMYLAYLGLPVNMLSIVLQLILGLILLIWGAGRFIHSIAHISLLMHVSPLLLSLFIIPIATELPEKINSILWIQRNKDTLAFGNITGAMVFQGSLLPAVGIALTPWQYNQETLLSIALTIAATLWLRYHATRHHVIKIWHLLCNGALYILYLTLAWLV